ncbi:hypothetical protein Tco_0716833 [Tanacetum coccineum]
MIHLSQGSDEGSLTLNELTVLCTSLSKKVECLESNLKQTKQTYGAAYTKLIMKVKKLEHKVKSIKARRKVRFVISDDEDDLEDPSKQGRKIAQIDEDEGITLVQMGAQTQGRSDEDLMYETGVYYYPEGFTRPNMDVTLAEALVDLLKSGKKKSPKPKARDSMLKNKLNLKDCKKRAAQEEASRAAIYDEMDNIQAMIEADEKLATRFQDEEQELYSIEEKSRLLMEMITERKRFFATQRAAEQRSKPPTKTQMWNRMCTYLKNIGGYKHNQLKGKSYEEIQKHLLMTTTNVLQGWCI